VKVLSLKSGILYGPINSRRLGKSLGINLMPAKYKLCSFNCVYCHFGLTDRHTMNLAGCLKDLPSFDDVVAAVEDAAKSQMEFGYMTFSGNGEPTLYPRFGELVDEVVRIRDSYRRKAKVALLSNSTGLVHEDVRESISKIDQPIFKLDAGTEEKFKAINRPVSGVDFSEIVTLLSSVKGIYLQTVLLEGAPSNVGENDLKAYFEKVSRIGPKEVHIYSIDRPVAHSGIRRVVPETLTRIAKRGRKETDMKIIAFYCQ
jgi:wyosine [tRNA(Phe)-imidazoG37] synthetase (radical SAM superfamily)